MTREYGNYPSFTFMASGNEPRGAWVPWVSKFVDYWKATDSRRVYTGASVGQGWAWQPKSQYHVKAGVRGLSWNNSQPETMSDYRSKIDTIKQPYVSHETGQWCAFPNFDEIKKYTGVTRAKNFELFQEDLADKKIQYGKDVVQHYSPVFWNTSWFKMCPPHTTGLRIDNLHPVFNDFVTENWGNMQWWELANRTQIMLLTDFPKGFQPIVQPIDTWFVNRKLGLLYEAKVGKGKLIMTSIDLTTNLEERPVAECLFRSIINYMKSDKFEPAFTVDSKTVSDLFTKTAAPFNTYTKSSPDELKKDVK